MFEQQQFEFAEDCAASQQPGRLREYVRLCLAFFKVYFEGRILVAQNLILTCRLQLWEITFLYLRIQIFLVRLARGFPVAECWPGNNAMIRD